MEISRNDALTAITYGTAAGAVAMVTAHAVLVGAGAGAKAGAYVADYFKNESVAQNLRIKGDQLISLAGKYAATELKIAAALVTVGGSAAWAQYSVDNEIPCDKNDGICKMVKLYETQGMCFDKKVNLTEYEEKIEAIRKSKPQTHTETAPNQVQLPVQSFEKPSVSVEHIGATLGLMAATVLNAILYCLQNPFNNFDKPTHIFHNPLNSEAFINHVNVPKRR